VTVEDTYHLIDNKLDILTHPNRRDQIHILTVDPTLGMDVRERIRADDRFKHCAVIRPDATSVRGASSPRSTPSFKSFFAFGTGSAETIRPTLSAIRRNSSLASLKHSYALQKLTQK